ncbi:molybdopterin converting factor subunit MoaD [Haloferula helveola]|uniref:Molybdopterin converting factor subunit MoaD n=1 Tax=Haloferula helveola TaxID=490095 RepID=A0ABM7RIL2_9BACT|nr:molybdopterin converting factor subunit MoaD [Haloferula helveola]
MKVLILAGGRSKRMGRDKANIVRPDGTRQLDYIFELAKSVSDDVSLSSNDPSVQLPGIDSIPDALPENGPLGAMLTFGSLVEHTGTVLIIGCDLFLLDRPTLEALIGGHRQDAYATCFSNRIDGRPEPLCAIYSEAALDRLDNVVLERDGKCARHFIESLNPTLLQPPNPVALDNANSPHDLDEAFAKLTHGVTPKTVRILYFAKLREARGLDEEAVETLACTCAGLYEELRFRHRLPLDIDSLRCARNGDFCDWDTLLEPDDEIVFIPPVAGG